MDITPYLSEMVERQASDLFLYTGAPIHIKVDGVVRPATTEPLPPGAVQQLLETLIDERLRAQFRQALELDFVIQRSKIGRFRASAFMQRGEAALAIRYIQHRIPSIESLRLPGLLKDQVMHKNGLILVVGATGSGKSTTLAAMIDHRNSNMPGHILTIEDPIEYLHPHKRSVVGQREIGMDTHSYENALKSAMREAPDVILIGEVRDQATMKFALHYAETGHLCLSTLHSSNARAALERTVNFFPEAAREQFLQDLALNLRAIISQRLIPGVDGKLVVAVEVMLNSPYIAELIQKGKLDILKDAMQRGRENGMQTFDQAVLELHQAGRISREQAIHFADSSNNVALQIRLSSEQKTPTLTAGLSQVERRN